MTRVVMTRSNAASGIPSSARMSPTRNSSRSATSCGSVPRLALGELDHLLHVVDPEDVDAVDAREVHRRVAGRAPGVEDVASPGST